MGPDPYKMLKPGFKSLYKYAGLVVCSNKRYKQMGGKMFKKRDHSHSQQIKVNNFAVSLWVKRRENLNPISIATKA